MATFVPGASAAAWLSFRAGGGLDREVITDFAAAACDWSGRASSENNPRREYFTG
jgi:hypothetical protein